MTGNKKFFILIFAVLGSAHVYGATLKQPPKTAVYENEWMRISLSSRTPDQMSAFYHGREFPKTAVTELRNYCFFLTEILNKSDPPISYRLSTWTFNSGPGMVRLYRRDYWKEYWQQQQLSKAKQSTFRWSSFPEQREIRRGEFIGGLIYLQPTNKPIELIALVNRNNHIEYIQMKDLRCARDE